MSSATIQQKLEAGLMHHRAGRLEPAESLYRAVLSESPNQADALNYLGVVLHQQQRHEEAVELLKRAIAINDEAPAFHNNLGEALRALGAMADAEQSFRRAIAIKSDYPDPHYNLGNALLQQGEFEKAIGAYEQAIRLKSDYFQAYTNVAIALSELGRLDESIASYQRAVAINPDYWEAHNNLAVALLRRGESEKALACLQELIQRHPEIPEAHNNLAKCWLELCQIDKALASFRKAVELSPTFAEAHSNLLLSMHYAPDPDVAKIFAEHLRWAENNVPGIPVVSSHSNVRNPERRLRIGYVSPDFRQHSLAYFFQSVMANHDHERFEIFCYSDVSRGDDMTQRLRGFSDHWLDVMSFSDEQLVQRVIDDRIDILVDLAGHTANNRLFVFIRKPAPIQMTYLGYPDTIGLRTIQYRITDAFLDPVGLTDRFHTEQLIRLPDCFLCYTPTPDTPEVELTPPVLHSGRLTFASFNSAYKVTDKVVEVWSRILRAIPNSTLAVLVPGTALCHHFREVFAGRGVGADRLIFWGRRSRKEFLALHARADILLDPFPYNGQTTTCDALWMGVPVVSLAGAAHVSRMGLCLLSNLGLRDLVATNAEQYVQIATRLATDVPRLIELRATVRDRMKHSPITDGPGFTKNFEAALRRQWRQSCA